MTGKLYGTLGPACADTDTLRALLRAGMRGVRLNLSHGPLAERAPWLESLRRAETAEGVSCDLLIDLQGPELRVGALFAPLTLREGDTLTLGEAFPVPPILTGNLQDGDELLLDDGALSLRVLDARAMTCRVERGGVLRSHKSLAVAGRELPASALTEMDMENLSRAREYGVTALMQPFVRGADDLRTVRAALRETGAEELKIFAKIENMTGLHRLDEILPLADVVVIARGDLGNAMPLWELPRAQTLIARKCRAAKRPFMVSTQMLHSMHHAAVPTRAEVTDVYQAARSGADYLLLTGETAVGNRVNCIANPHTCRETEYDLSIVAEPKKVFVAGAGVAGLAAAYGAAERGHKVTVFEASDEIGGQWLSAMTPPGKSEYASLILNYRNQLKKYGAQIRLETPLTREIVEAEKPDYAIVQFGGQTAINLAAHLEKLGVPILGTPAWSIDAAEDREKFDVILEKCGIPRPAGHTVMTEEEAVKAADELGYPVLVRPSYVLGGQGMEIAYKEADVREFMQVITRNKVENPVLVDKYMMGREIEVDAICDGDDILIPGIMEHFERAGVHSGDSISIYPSINIEKKHKDTLVRYTESLAKNLAVLGLVNIQFVLYNDQIYVIEVNPRSSRTVPYISKVTGVPMVDLATRCMFGEKLRDMGCGTGLHPESDHYAVKVPVFSFQKLRDLDTQLGPEMKSTGEVLGVAKSFREALLKGLTGAGFQMKKKGAVLISVRDSDKQEAIRIGERFEALGFDIYATSGTANVLNRHMVATNAIRNVDEPSPNIIDLIESGKIDYVVATSVKGRHPELGSVHIRRTAVERAIPCLTSMDTVSALLRCLEGDIKIENCEMIDINSI